MRKTKFLLNEVTIARLGRNEHDHVWAGRKSDPSICDDELCNGPVSLTFCNTDKYSCYCGGGSGSESIDLSICDDCNDPNLNTNMGALCTFSGQMKTCYGYDCI